MELHKIPVDEIKIPANRQRQVFEAQELMELTDSIREHGLLHPIVVRRQGSDWFLVAGERRMKAIQSLWLLGDILRCSEVQLDEGILPAVSLGDLSPLAAEEAELEENVKRTDLSWQEKAQATSRLAALRKAQAEAESIDPPTISDIAEEITGVRVGSQREDVRQEIIVSKFLGDAEVSKAKNLNEAFKILKRKETTKKNEELAKTIGSNFLRSQHKILQGDCIELLRTSIPDEHYDVVLTDPPYGIGADEFGDSGGKAAGGHFYKDDFVSWLTLMSHLCPQLYRIAKPQSHLYMFCDVDNFVTLREMLTKAGWKMFRTPFVWHKPSGMRAPWPEMGPQRKYELIAFGVKGGKKVTKLYPDVLSYTGDNNLGHNAQKPVALYEDLLRRSITPGDEVIDPCCGSGAIFPAAHSLKCKATGIEIDAAAYGIAIRRMQELE